ncbi:conserved hypothetical protein [Tenacibaculum sp. 190524A05c]|uniref:hypothetical protein n=1 Tax=Tenacibaculum platacis TaxID=3137852 RepID=UPI0031FAFAEF
MSKFRYILFFTLCYIISYSQSESPLEQSRNDIIQSMTDVFENTICDYYKIETKNSHEAIKRFLADSGEDFRDYNKFKNIVTPKTTEKLNESLTELRDYIWITKKQRRKKSGRLGLEEFDEVTLSQMTPRTIRYYKKMQSNDNDLVLNYFDKFSEKLMLESNNEDIIDLILTFREVPNDYPSIIALALKDLTEKDFKNSSVKTFIAFELYYSYLNLQLQDE